MKSFYYLKSLKILIGKIEKVLNECVFYLDEQLPENKILEDKILAPTLCEALNEEGDFKGTWKVGDTKGLATYLVYERFLRSKFPISRSKFPKFSVYSRKHKELEKLEKPYFLIDEIDDGEGEYEISMKY